MNKRGLDLGMGRGFSGSQAAKQLMGLSAASFAGGPGRRKRQATPARILDQHRQDQMLVGTSYDDQGQGENLFRR